MMSKSALLSVRMSDNLADRLEHLAKATERSKSYLAAQAIEEYIAVQEWQITAIQEGMDAARAGDVVPHEEALSVLESWEARNTS